MQRESQLEFSFDHWISVNKLDPEICRVLKEKKIDSVTAILSLKEDDIRQLFKSFPMELLNNLWESRNFLASIISSGQKSSVFQHGPTLSDDGNFLVSVIIACLSVHPAVFSCKATSSRQRGQY